MEVHRLFSHVCQEESPSFISHANSETIRQDPTSLYFWICQLVKVFHASCPSDALLAVCMKEKLEIKFTLCSQQELILLKCPGQAQ